MGQNLSSYERVYLNGNKASKYKFLKSHKYFILNGLILSIFTTIYIKIINNYKKKLLEKDKEIEKLKENIFQNQIQVISTEQKDNKIDDYKKYSYNLQDFNFEENFSYDKKFYKLNNMRSTEDINRLDYELLMAEHSLEKGLSHFNLRPFGKKPLKRILKFINLELKYEHSENHFAFSTAINLSK